MTEAIEVVRAGVDLRQLPKVSLHDHLDGAIRPATVVALAQQLGIPLPASSADGMATWFTTQARGTLEQFLSTFGVITPLLQRAEALAQLAREYVLDLAADGVVYGEVRWAPEQHVRGDLSLTQACDAVASGLRDGMDEVRRAGTNIDVREIYCAMRQATASAQIAEMAIARRDLSVVGFDFAGPEAGYPVSGHRRAIEILHDALFPLTIHAGEAAGLASITDALAVGQPVRLGHATHLIDDIERQRDGEFTLGRVAEWVRDREITLECCPTSNLVTDAMDSYGTTLADHPLGIFTKAGFRVTVNTDDRTQTGVTLSQEFANVMDAFGYDLHTLAALNVNAVHGAFLPLPERDALQHQLASGWSTSI